MGRRDGRGFVLMVHLQSTNIRLKNCQLSTERVEGLVGLSPFIP